MDPRNDKVFYIGKGIGNRVFSHEIESGKSPSSEKKKLHKIRDIEENGYSVKRLIVAVYKPNAWYYGSELDKAPQRGILKPEDYKRLKSRVYFTCNDYTALDDEGKFYLNKSIVNLKVNQSAQNPITYLSPIE